MKLKLSDLYPEQKECEEDDDPFESVFDHMDMENMGKNDLDLDGLFVESD